jgi:hypothetical protein
MPKLSTAKWSPHPPTNSCFAVFRGERQLGSSAQVEMLCEPVEVRLVEAGKGWSFAVAMTGRQTLFRLDQFHGEWWVLDLEVNDAKEG